MFVVDRSRIIISRNAAHLRISYDVNPDRPSDRVQKISIQSTVVTIPLSISVCEIEVPDKKELSRKCVNHEGVSVNWLTVPWALACPEQEVARDFQRYLDQHAKDYAQTKGPWVGALERLASEHNGQYGDLLNNQLRLSLAEDWKLGSAFYTDPLPGDVQIPPNWKTLPGLYALPRRVVIGLNRVFDKVIQPILDTLLSHLEHLEPSPKSLHIIYLVIRILSTHIEDVITDMERRESAGAPGSSDASLKQSLRHSRELLRNAFSSAIKRTNITYMSITNKLPREIWSLHEGDQGSAHMKSLKSFFA